MEKIAHKVENMLEEKISFYKELQSILEEEKGYIVSMDVDSLWKTIAPKKQIALQLKIIMQQIVDLLEKRAVELGMDYASFGLSDFIKKMPVSREIKSKLRNSKLALETCKKTVSTLASANQKYIKESLVVIDDIFSMAVNTANEKEYNNSGSLLENKEKNNLINAEV